MATRTQVDWRVEPPFDAGSVGADSPGAGTPAERMQTALDLFAMGMEMLRTRLRREEPGLSAEEIEQRVERWLRTRRGAEDGDAQGRSVPWPRKSR